MFNFVHREMRFTEMSFCFWLHTIRRQPVLEWRRFWHLPMYFREKGAKIFTLRVCVNVTRSAAKHSPRSVRNTHTPWSSSSTRTHRLPHVSFPPIFFLPKENKKNVIINKKRPPCTSQSDRVTGFFLIGSVNLLLVAFSPFFYAALIKPCFRIPCNL